MITESWLYDSILYIYALSLLFYFSDFIGSNRNAKRMATGLLLFVWVMQTSYFVGYYWYRLFHVYSMFETLFFFSWFLVTLSLIIQRFIRIEMFVFFANVIGFSVLALNIFSNPDITPSIQGWNINDDLLFIHITLAIGSYVAFFAAAVFSGMYIFLHIQLKNKHWSSTMKRLPSLEKIDRYTYIAVMLGTPLLIMALSLGVVWITLQENYRLLVDPKVLSSMFVLGGYVYYLIQRLSLRAPGIKLAVWNMIIFLVVVFNFLFSNLYSDFHHWIWMGD